MASRYAFSGYQFPQACRANSFGSVGWLATSLPASRPAGKTRLENAARALLTPHRSFKLVALKLVTPGKAHLEQHCA